MSSRQESYLELERYLVKAEADFGAALKLGQSGSDSQSTSGKPPRVPPIKSHQQRQENSAEIVTTTTTNQQERSRPWRFQSEVSKGITRLSSAFSRSLTESTKVSSVGSNRPVPLPRHRKIRDSNPTVGEAALDSGGSVRRLAAKYSRETSASKYTFQPASQTYSSPHTSPVRQRTKPVEFDSQFRWSQGSKLNEQQNSDLWRPPAKRYLSYVDVVRPQSLAISTSSNSSIGLSQKNSAWSVTSIVDNSQRSYSEQSALNSVETTHKRVAPLTQRRSFISETRRSLKEEELSGKSFAPLSPICGSPSPRTPRTAGSPRNFMFPDETVPTTRVILRPNPKVLRVAPMAATRDYSQASEPDLRLDTTGNRGNLGGSKSSFRLSASSFSAFKPPKDIGQTRGISNSVATLDFTDLDSISKWTSSVLAELESIDLNLTDTEDRLSGGEAQPSVTPTSASFANTIGLFESERRWPGAVATSQTSRRGSSVPPKRSEERRDEKSPEDINEVPMEAKLTLEKALEDLRHIETFSREVAGRGRTGQRTKPSAFPTNKTSVLTHSPLAKPVMLNCQSNTWPTPISAGQEVSEPMSDREVSYKSLVETSQQQPTVAIQILTESNAVLKLGDSDMVETPLASPTDAHSVGGATPVPSEAYQADDETRDDLNSPSPRPTYFQTRKKADETSNSAKEVPAVPHDPMSKGRVESWMQESAAKSPPKPAPRTSIKKENGNVTQHLKLSKNPKKDVSIGAQGDSLKASAQQVDDSRSKQQSTKSPELGADKNHNSQQRPTDAYHRGSCPPVVPVKLRYNQDSNSSRLERFSQPTTVQSNGQSVAKGRRSVHGVVESIIRQVQSHVPFGLHEGQTGQTIRHSEGSEHSRSVQHDSNDNFTPYHLQAAQSELSPTGEDFLPEVSDAFTQTSPVSLSRSSSFTWLSDLEVYEDSDQRQSFLLDQMDNYRSEAHLQMRQIYETDRPNSAHSSTLVDLADQPEDISDSSSTDEGEMSREHDGPDTQELSRSYENDSQLLSELSGVASSEEEEFSLSRISGRDYVAQYSGEPSVPKFAQHPDAQLIVATGKYAIIGLSKAQRDGIRLQQPSTTLPSSSEIWTGDDTELAAQQQSRLTSASLSAGHRNSIKESPTAPSESEKSNSDNFQLNRRSIPPSLTINDSTAAWKTGEKAVPHGQIPRMGMINTERRGKFESNRLGGPHLALQGDNSGNGSGKDMISGGRRLGVEERVQVQEATKAGWTDNCLHSQEEQKSNNESSDLSLSSARDFLCFNNSSPSSSGTETENIAQAAGGAVPTGNSQPFQQQRQTLSVSGPRMEFAELRRKSLELTLSHAYPSSSPSHRCSADHTGLSTELSVKGRQALQEAHSVLMSITKAEREWLSASPESNGTLTSAESPFENISVTSTPITPAEGFNTRGPMPRDVSLASGILADNESSPLSPEQQRFAILNASDASASAVTSPESTINSFAASAHSHSIEPSGSSNNRPSGFEDENFFYSERSAKLKAEAEEILMATSMQEPMAVTHQQAPFPLLLALEKSPGMTSSLPTLDRLTSAASAENLNGQLGSGATLNSSQNSEHQGPATGNKERAESEARECCRWLRAAGFPQYAQMYEDHLFPVDISAVQRDHEFLDQDSLEALYRRLLTLNRCAVMKIDSFLHNTPDEESDDEDVAISRQWRYQRKSRTWSRVPAEFADPSQSGSSPTSRMAHLRDDSAESVGITGTESFELQHYSRSDSKTTGAIPPQPLAAPLATVKRENSGGGLMAQSLMVGIAHTTEDIETNSKPSVKPNSKLQRSSSERIKNKAKAFVRKIDNIRSGSTRRSVKKGGYDSATMEIGSPVLVSHVSSGPSSMQMLSMAAGQNCSQQPSISGLSHVSRDRSAPPPREFTSNSRPTIGRSVSPRHQPWRYGKIFLTSSDSSSVEFVTQRDSKLRQSNEVVVDRLSSGNGSTATFLLDANSNNIDKIFLPNLPKSGDRSSGSSPLTVVNGGSQNSLTRCGIRTNAKFRPDASRLGSPQINRKANESPATVRDGVPLVLFNPNYDMPPVERTVVSGNRSASRLKQDKKLQSEGLDSSPDFSSRSTPTANSLRVQVDVESHSTNFNHGVLTHSSLDSSDTDSPKHWERRDSGVGSSLSRSPSVPAKPRVRWHSFQRQQKTNHLGVNSPAIDSLSVTQLTTLQKFALLKLTALMEKYSHSTRNNNWNWGVTRFLKKMKMADYKGIKDQQVFGVPFFVIAQRTGQPLPQCILQAMKFLRQQAPDALGLFRKPGVRSRIAKLKFLCENSADLLSFESSQAYDVADMVKQYFRELPEPVMTAKLSETFLAIQQYLPQHLRLEAMQKAILLLPDENREVLQTLLMFLYDIAMHCETNQMTAQNLAVCFAPTLFQLSPRVGAMSPTRRHKTIGGGMPNEKELSENCAAQQILAEMIRECRKLFTVPGDILSKCSISLAEDVEPALLRQLGSPEGNYFTYLDGCVDALVKEHREKWRGWVTAGSVDGVEISSKKVHSDDYPLRLWRCWADVEAPPKELLSRVIRERELWDDDIVKWRVVSKLADNCELFQYVCNDMPPHPTRDYLVIRLWKTEVPELRGGCVLVETSVTVPEVSALGGIRGTILASRCLIEPSGSGRSRITHVGRIDTRGRSKIWYSKVFGHICGSHIARIRDSFRQVAEGPETKV